MSLPVLLAEKARMPKDEVLHEAVLPPGVTMSREATGRKDRAIEAIFV
jgi:hypothetical protein